MAETQTLRRATFGSGCFWCTEAIFRRLKGVKSVVAGYAGGDVENPSYEQVCSGTTGHAEVVQMTFEPTEVSYRDLLEVFFRTHDPTTRNRQGHDVGTQYRSTIFYHDDDQRRLAEQFKQALETSGEFAEPIVTEIHALTDFYAAEDYHQNFYGENKRHPYCTGVIVPKLRKFEKAFTDRLQSDS